MNAQAKCFADPVSSGAGEHLTASLAGGVGVDTWSARSAPAALTRPVPAQVDVVHLDPAIVQEHRQARPVPQLLPQPTAKAAP